MKARCAGCGAEVLWIRTASSRRKTPIDAEPVWVLQCSGGNTFFRLDGSIIFGRKVGDAYDSEDPDSNLVECYESHFSTCPVGGQFRNRKPRTRSPGYR